MAYNIGLVFSAIMMEIKGVIQVLSLELTSSKSAMIADLQGLGYIVLGLSLIMLLWRSKN